MKNYYILILGLMLMGCNTQVKSNISDQFDDSKTMVLQLKEDSLESMDSIFIINNLELLGKVLGHINQTRMPGIELPSIDFSTEIYLVFNQKIPAPSQNDINILKVNQGEISFRFENNTQLDEFPPNVSLIKIYRIDKFTGDLKAIQRVD